MKPGGDLVAVQAAGAGEYVNGTSGFHPGLAFALRPHHELDARRVAMKKRTGAEILDQLQTIPGRGVFTLRQSKASAKRTAVATLSIFSAGRLATSASTLPRGTVCK